ncbi:HAD-IIIA family hydrolase [Candidatus Peregrinibacteria bacterium]|nr:HAD-IIIA family hydrolase [Candidatus Peregrinibacteria bacterium]MBI5733010.1 HAD-IIIA family hydrolase [Candidatus Jorgensenbacteria bacterium]
MSKKKAIFLDRDGTIIRHVDLPHRAEDLRLLPGVADAIKTFSKLGFINIVISNQPVVARGLINLKEAEALDRYVIIQLARRKAVIDAVYRCPHHPKATLKKYRRRCRCRKPGTGMFIKAIKKFKIDTKQSFMIGDSIIDVVAGCRVGVKTILVKTGPGHARLDKLYNAKPDFFAHSLKEAASIVRKINRKV